MDILKTLYDYNVIWEKAYAIAHELHLSKVKKGIGAHINEIEFPDPNDIDENSTFYVSWDETWRYGGRSTESARIPFRYLLADDWEKAIEDDQKEAA